MPINVTPGAGATLKSRLDGSDHVVSHDIAINVFPTPPPAVFTNKVTVTTAGTRVQFSSQVLVRGVWIRATGTNLGLIYLGGSAVSSSNGYDMAARDTVFVEVSNLNILYIDASINAQSVSYIGY